MKLDLDKNVTPEKLIKAGFKNKLDNKEYFTFREYLYGNLISLLIIIDFRKDEHEQLEWYVLDGNTQMTYNAFYFTHNTCKDLVREECHKNFNEVIGELVKRRILHIMEE